jgi:hypothetical protein
MRFTQPEAAQKVCPAMPQVHIPPRQSWPGMHTVPQRPQFMRSVIVLVQPVPSQKVWPVMPQTQRPPVHTSPGRHALGIAVVLHAPQ